ncbi:MAG: hypothetical protein NZ959_11875 [Armatimonadetes bacterium]|nr:hypothetical protein [Armatimonadota bacterium]MDW8122681.1 hypothetical protein [Armatimonadota bacterium]
MIRVGLLIGIAAIVLAGPAQGKEQVSVWGTLKGYFLSPQGEVLLRSVPLASDRPSVRPKEELHLLWAGYYFEGKLRSVQPVKKLSILAGDRTIWTREFPKPVLETSVPDLNLPLQLHTRYGHNWRIHVAFEPGTSAGVPLLPSEIRFRPVLPLKIDWLDLVRIQVVKDFLSHYGDKVFTNWNAHKVPFAIQGENDQWVFINHPNPPRGAKRYRGPSPLKEPIWVVDQWLSLTLHPETAETPELEGVHTVVLPFRPYWFALPEFTTTRTTPEALMRIATILHECFHAWYYSQPFQRLSAVLPGQWTATNYFGHLFAALKQVESTLLSQSLTTQDIDLKNQALRRFLAMRRHPKPKPEYQLVLTAGRVLELGEGVSHIVEQQAFQLLLESWDEYYARLSADPFVPKQPVSLTPRWRNYLNTADFTGAAQLTLMERFGYDWKERLRKSGFHLSLDEILYDAVTEKAVGWMPVPPEEETTIGEEVWKQVEERVEVLRQERELIRNRALDELLKRSQEDTLGLWVKVSLPKNAMSPSRAPQVGWNGQWHEWLDVSVWDCRAAIRRLCWVSEKTMQSLVLQVYLPLKKDEVFWRRWRHRDLEVKGKDFELYIPQARVIKTKERLWLVGQSRSLSGVHPIWTRRVNDVKRSVWLATSLSILLGASHHFVGAQVPEGVTLTATISGTFRDADTGQIAYLSLNALSDAGNPPGDWHTVVGERYTFTVTIESLIAQPMSLTLLGFGGQQLSEAVSTQPSNRLSVQGQDRSPYGCKTRYRLRLEYGPRHFPTCQTTWGIWAVLEPYHVAVPPPEFGTVVVHAFDGASGRPLRGAGIRIPEVGILDVTSEQGIWTGTLPANAKTGANYTIIISGPHQSIPWCVIERKIRLYMRSHYETRAWLWQHRPIVGQIRFDGRPGDPRQATVRATKGTQSLGAVINSDGSFIIPGSGGAPDAGEWTVSITYPGALFISPPSRTVTVPNDCEVGAIRPGSHTPVDAGTFIIRLPIGAGG